MVDMTNSKFWAQGTRCYEKLKVVVDMSYYKSWAHDFRWYEYLRVMDDMNDLGYHELKSSRFYE